MSDFLRKVQMAEYDILKELDRVCKKHNIKYFLGQGTLLGAAKYKKFIPWDDDIDLLLDYKELKKVHNIFPKEGREDYFLTSCNVEKHFPLVWSKIRAKNTLSRPVRYKSLPINWGICIDLFPVYPISNFAFLRKLEYINMKIASKLLLAEMTKYEQNHSFLVRILEKIPICLRHLYLKFAVKLLSFHSDKTRYVYVACKGGKVVERELLFGEEKTLPFENCEFPVPADYHTYLTQMYGDYMAPLPKEQQGGHDLKMGEIEWKL